jgi:hypothetical protein
MLKTVTLEMDEEVSVVIIDRSDPDAITAVTPAKDGQPTRRWTQVEWLAKDLADGQKWFGRTDCALVNIYYTVDGRRLNVLDSRGNPEWMQYAIFFTPDGEVTDHLDGHAMQYLTPDHLSELKAIADRLLEVSLKHPEMGVYLGRDVRYCKGHDVYNCWFAHNTDKATA